MGRAVAEPDRAGDRASRSRSSSARCSAWCWRASTSSTSALTVYITFLYSIPSVALVPLIVLWAGYETTAKIIILFMFAFFPMVINTYQGVKIGRSEAARGRPRVPLLGAAALGQHRAARRAAVHRHRHPPRGRPRHDRHGAGRPLHRDLRHRLSDRAHRQTFQVDKMFVPIVTLGLLGVTLTALLRWWRRRWRRGPRRGRKTDPLSSGLMPASSPPAPISRSRPRSAWRAAAGVVPTTSTPIAAIRSWKPLVAMTSALARLRMSMIGAGVPAGATRPTPEPTSKPGNVSASAGTSGSDGDALESCAAPSATSLPSLISGKSELIAPMKKWTRPAKVRRRRSRRGTAHAQIDAGAELEQLAAEMLRRATPNRGVAHLPRLFLRQRDKLLQVARGNARRHDHDERNVDHHADRRIVGNRVERRIARHVRHDGERHRRDQKQVTVG